MEHGYKHVIIYDEKITRSRIEFISQLKRSRVLQSPPVINHSDIQILFKKSLMRNLYDVNTAMKISMKL